MTVKDDLHALGIYNPYEATKRASTDLGQTFVYIDYRGADRISSPRWQVILPGGKTDPDGHWMDYGDKSFILVVAQGGKYDKDATLQQAKDWAAENYGVADWVKIPGLGGAWFPQSVAEHIRTLIRAEKKAGV